MQFSLRTMLIATAFPAVALGGMLAASQLCIVHRIGSRAYHIGLGDVMGFGAISAPFWVPIVVASFAVGRRSATNSVVACLIVFEALAVCCASGLWFLAQSM
jgi:hypothetical protein